VLGAVIDRVLLIVLTPIAWVIQKLIELFLGNRDPLPQLVDATQQRVGEASSNKTESQSALQQGVVYALRVLALAIILAVTAGLTVLFVRMRRRLRAVQLEAAQSGAAGSLGQDLRTLWGSLFQRESSGRRGEASSRAIRLYQDVLERAEETGHPRGVGQTAEEFAPTLADTFRAEVTDDITAAFEQARYADREPDAATLIELERRWRLVR
jgi:hypothetical protein